MKTLVLGDIHGRTCWKNIIEIEQPDKIIFLGDYVSTHENISEEQQISNLREIMDYKIQNNDKVILLRGNHDMQHCGFAWASFRSGLYWMVQKWLMENIDEFLDLTQWVHIEDNIIFSHAGISKRWFKDSNFKSIEDINNSPVNCKFAFNGKFSDYTGISETQPLTWIRPGTLVFCAIPDYIQVVGHTPVKTICNFTEFAKINYKPSIEETELDFAPPIWCCDNLPKEYLVIEDKQFKVKNYE